MGYMKNLKYKKRGLAVLNIFKIIILLLIFLSSTIIGVLLSKKYINRVIELKEIKNSLNIFKTKIKYTYEPIPEVFKEIGVNTKQNIANIFINASNNMEKMTAGEAWIESIRTSSTNMNKEDLNILKNLSKLLGKTDIEGQISEIELTSNFINTQIEKAEKERVKNEKLYKTLGMVTGMAIVIILI